MNKIGLDLSLNSSALCLEKPNGEILLFNYTNTKKSNKWNKEIEDSVIFRYITYDKIDNYSEFEVYKIKKYDEITDIIINDILTNIDNTQPTKINIEGYSFSSNTNSVIDIVNFSAILRFKLYKYISTDINIFSPKTVKLQTCISIYGYLPAPIGKKGQILKDPMITCNHQNIVGGSWDKSEMMLALIEGNIDSPISEYIKANKSILFAGKKIPKPFDDLVDSIHIKNLGLETVKL